jgi:hypothetical protein
MHTELDDPLRADPTDRADLPKRRTRLLGPILGALLGLAAVASWVWWSQQPADPIDVATLPTTPEVAPAPVAEPAVKYPLAEATETETLPASGIAGALAGLLGGGAASLLHTEDFARRFVATVDNLGREHAPPLMWPVAPSPGRFSVREAPGGAVIAAANAERYAPLVQLVAQTDPATAATVYRRMYPHLQQAYRELGFGDRYFNDRLVEVIDLLLATPEPAAPPRLQLTEVKGPVPSTRPWVRYEFADPRLQQLAAGQKMLLRVGPEHRAVLKAKLSALRDELVVAAPATAER